ncbi:MAG: hypothetical protein GWP05_05745 [Anaerolineaceae bacterium]|nr:hypothetical protein [Anaerolineaceae bacterium]
MATKSQYRAYDEVLNRVNDVRMRLTVRSLLDGLLGAVALGVVVLLLAVGLQVLARFDSTGREVLRVALLAGLGAALLRAGWIVVRRQWTDEQTARFIETRVPEAGNSLINILQLVSQSDRWSPLLLDKALLEAARSVRGVELEQAVCWRRVIRFAVAAGGAGLLLGMFVLAAPQEFGSALGQVLHPRDFVPTRSRLRLEVSPGNVELVRGQPLRIEVRIENPEQTRYDVRLMVIGDGEKTERQLAMVPGGQSGDAYSYEWPEVSRPMKYRVEAGRSQSDYYRVSVREKAVVKELTVATDYPPYTRWKAKIEKNVSGNLRVPVGTKVTMTVATSGPVRGCTLRFGKGRAVPCMAGNAERSAWRASWTVLAADTYTIELKTADWPANGNGVEYRVEAIADAEPTVAIVVPGQEVTVPPGGKVRTVIRAADDYGFRRVQLFVGPAKATSAAAAKTWRGRPIEGLKKVELEWEIAVPKDAPLGAVYEYYAEATDNLVFQGGATRRDPHVVRSDTLRIVVKDTAAVARARLKEASDLYGRLYRLLRRQREARQWTGSLATVSPQAAVARVAEVAKRQKEIRAEATDIAATSGFTPETMAVKTTLELLVQNQMREAVLKSQSLSEIAAKRPDRRLQRSLAATQNEIIVVLERLLEVAQGRIKVAKAALGQEGTDLPADVEKKLRTLSDKLKEFIDQQRKVIEETEKLAKKPVDDFTDEDRRKLKSLAMTQDKWEKFLAEAISDLSKLPVLEAGNPSLLKELIEVKVDIEMARDALKKDAVEIAVALENAGAELAEEIVENLERWLPDQPDRIKWTMEEPLEQPEIPHSELPEQLEDLVGELFEEEEDIFDEMEDTTSGWADSLDKGAGWDAMDGPISNYSAKGVTGNQLPNTSEIGGRSGEGRTGKASGEMVEDTATGKGGRRTPTRVTADPFQTGEITDSSKDPPGGATGGGKISGSGEEGFEGPVPRETERKMQRLAGRQATVRSKAERINIELKVRNYESFNLDQALRSMRKVERELLAGRYRNAMREKHVLLNQLKSTRMLLGGEIRVRTDRRSNLPDGYRKEIEESAKGPMPEGYEELIKQYYQRLSEGG